MEGGKLLAEGGYGCVFSPGINCNGSMMTTKKYVSKIQPFDKSARNEIEIGKIIQTINGYINHFSPVIKNCSINIATIRDEDKNKCTIIKKKKTKKFILMKLLYINGKDFIDYMIKHKNSVQIVDNIINSYNHMLRALSMLIGKKLIHYDLKGTNILFDETKQAPLLIDFGLSIQVDKINMENLKNIFYVFAPQYYVWPLEVHYISYILHKKKEPVLKDLKMITNIFIKNNKALTKNFSPNFIKKYNEKCLKQLKIYNALPYAQRLEKIVNYWNTFDNYSLSIMYLKFISYINIEGYSKNHFIIFFSKLLLQNIDPVPENRLNILETIHTFNGFLYKKNMNNVVTFEQIADSFIEKRDIINDALKIDRKEDISNTKKAINYFKKSQSKKS